MDKRKKPILKKESPNRGGRRTLNFDMDPTPSLSTLKDTKGLDQKKKKDTKGPLKALYHSSHPTHIIIIEVTRIRTAIGP